MPRAEKIAAKYMLSHLEQISDMTIGRDSVTKRVAELAILETFYLGIIARGPLDYETMLQNTMTSSDMNK